MKKFILLFSVPVLVGLMTFNSYSQNKTAYPVVDSDEYEELKKAGNLPEIAPGQAIPSKVIHVSANVQKGGSNPQIMSGANCDCWIPTDATYTSAGQCDDCSFGPFTLPFLFCFYGTLSNQIYINNNGNVSFLPYQTYTPTNFPTTLFSMVAPYWADVDTRAVGSGVMKYKITPTALYVNWESVGYYSFHTDKLCTFQLIITDGNDPVLPAGANVSFCYKDMDWTTGDASGGNNGFGGTPATNGTNKGDGVNFVQFGRFDNPSANYDGPFGANDGVDWLDDKNFTFSICNSVGVNIPPAPAGISSCDTVVLCLGDTMTKNVLFLSPESGQITTANASIAPASSGFSIVSNVPGNFASITTQFIGTAPGTYTISYTGTDNGVPPITTTGNIVVKVDTMNAPPPVITGNACASPGGVTLSVTGAAYSSYLWNTGATTASINGAGIGTYTVTVSSANGCTKTSAPFTVSSMTVTTASTPTSCGSNIGTATANPIGGGSPYTYSWSNGQTASTATGLSAGSYFVLVTDPSGCSQTGSVTVTNSNGPVTVMSQANILCNGQCTGNAAASVSGGSVPYTYLWSNGQTTSAANNLCAGTYSVAISDATGCSDVQVITITEPPAITASVSSTQESCGNSNGTATVTAAGGSGSYTYLWNNLQTTSSISGLAAGNYSVLVSDANNCTQTQTVSVASAPPPSATTAQTDVLCFGECTGAAAIIASGGASPFTYLWSNGQTSSSATNLCAGNYTVSVSDAGGCTFFQTVIITQPASALTASANGDTIINPGGSAQLNSSGGTNYNWSPATGLSCIKCSNPVASPTSATIYCVTVSDANGCTDKACVSVSVEIDCGGAVYLPNAFSPNGDGLNDEECVVGDCLQEIHFMIFDRWGEKMFETNDLKKMCWDGKFRGRLQTSGVYAYYLRAINTAGETIRKTGNITIVK